MLMERGTLVRWNEEKGFGFIKPETANTKDVFIHISVLKQMARKPVVGDQILFHSERQPDGKLKASKASIEGVAIVASRADNKHLRRRQQQAKSSSFGSVLISLVILLGLGTLGFKKYEEMTATPILTNKDVEQMKFNPVHNFRCEAGKTHCSHMSSCEEAKFYIKYCPDTRMDGDDDGVPCERQLCSW
ncbi:excalibur calcium-binding domain-containing protein [Shewanella schlegeliana]|uniref:Excalibur calcium-binding domain-containing protein n=1 Tax=Shewanella schlegeliana TaxID=190308 RepID=A0ABS1SZF7_9GAMM|nr:excalibur calcium-binding domain-containing protein [Shewanella schlegeliana]MBL4912932.1 excalibur calcium-binding domain-containing protein [Shewanella schlegeliana]MCL1108972.1 excalibur calcium-binding domain-containing protein [Shewanella schlegeliana]GIU23492.1 cold-shock protein [Shewanella schlegeliana]